jgi:rhamnogalacturonyl hydrolase YesR
MKKLLLLLLSVFVVATSVDAKIKKKKIDPIQQRSTIEIITQVNDYWQQHHKVEVRSFWDEAAYHTGNMEAYKLLGVARWKNYSEDWARYNLWMGAREKDPSKWKYKTYGEGHDFVLFGDWQICFQTYLDLYELNPDPFKIKRAIEVMDTEVRSPETDFWWWADALYMVMPVLTKLYKATGEVKYLDKLYANFKWADELMYDKDEQLYYRDAKYIYPKVKTACNGGKSFWARGDGWVLAGLAKVLSDMPADYKHRDFFVQRFRELAEGVARVQRPGGYWSRSMLCEEDAPGPETSGTAFFTYGMLWGVNHGMLDRAVYEPVITKAWNYLVNTALQADGSVGFVQPIGEKPDPTKTVDAHSQANFGVGAFLLAACEKVRFDDSSVHCCGTAVNITVNNNTDEFRQEVVEIDAATLYKKVGIQGGRQFIVFDEGGLEVPYQLSYDGKVLLDAGVRPKGKLTFTVKKGTPKNYATVCYGRVYNERKDDYAWENDRGAYRVYGPALQRTGERSYGTDVWSKNTPELVVEQRYWIEDVVMMPAVEKLRKENRQRGDSLYRLNSYHNDHGRGMDLYKVGATLGCGTPALMVDGQLQYPYCFKTMEILDNGPMRTTVHLTYYPVKVNGDTAVVEHRYIQLDKGSNYNKVTVCYNGLTKPVSLATGVVLHSEDTENVEIEDDCLLYADPTDNVRVNNCQLFVGALFPQKDVETKKLLFDQPKGGNEGHVLGIKEKYRGENYTYYFGSAWSKYDVRTMDEWKHRSEWTLRSIRQPLTVSWN